MKKLLFGIAFLGSMLFTCLSVHANEHTLRWHNLKCSDGSGGTYEICWYTGNGNECSTYNQKTRNCDTSTDPGNGGATIN